MTTRVYCKGRLTQSMLADYLDQGLVCTDVVPKGCGDGDVAYFREGTPDEIAWCRNRLALPETTTQETNDAHR
jgi:hypothetical protein